jgi:hypothetical protein
MVARIIEEVTLRATFSQALRSTVPSAHRRGREGLVAAQKLRHKGRGTIGRETLARCDRHWCAPDIFELRGYDINMYLKILAVIFKNSLSIY